MASPARVYQAIATSNSGSENRKSAQRRCIEASSRSARAQSGRYQGKPRSNSPPASRSRCAVQSSATMIRTARPGATRAKARRTSSGVSPPSGSAGCTKGAKSGPVRSMISRSAGSAARKASGPFEGGEEGPEERADPASPGSGGESASESVADSVACPCPGRISARVCGPEPSRQGIRS